MRRGNGGRPWESVPWNSSGLPAASTGTFVKGLKGHSRGPITFDHLFPQVTACADLFWDNRPRAKPPTEHPLAVITQPVRSDGGSRFAAVATTPFPGENPGVSASPGSARGVSAA
jgi:hypothetical protein